MSEETKAITIANITNQEAGAIATSLQIDPTDRANSIKLFSALNNPNEKVSSHINEEIEVQDYLIEMAEIEDQDDFGNSLDTTSIVPRVVLISPDGTTYQATSVGIASVVKKLCLTCGNAPWNPAIKLKIKQQPTKRGSILTADMVG